MTPRTKLGLVGVATIVGASIGAWAMIPSKRFAYGVAPIAEGEAVLLTRRNESDDTWFGVQLVRRDGTVVWEAPTDGLQAAETLGFTAVAADDDRIALLGDRDGTTAVMALDRRSGERLWETRIADGENTFIGTTLVLDGSRVHATAENDGRVTVTSLALADGTSQWSFDATAHLTDGKPRQTIHVAPDRLAVLSWVGPGAVLDGATGEVVGRLPIERIGCETSAALVGVAGNTVTRVPRSSPTEGQVVALPEGLRPDADAPCGERGADLVLGGKHDDGEAQLVRVDPSSGAVRWKLSLGTGSFRRPATLGGRLPRLLPVVLDALAPEPSRTIVVDLDSGTIASEHPDDGLRMALVTEERAFVVEFLASTAFALHPEQGELERVIRFRGAVGNELRVEDFRFGELWLYGSELGPPDDLDWAVFDLGTGTTTATHGRLVAVDVSEAGWAGP